MDDELEDESKHLLYVKNRTKENGMESAPEIEAMDNEQQLIIEDVGGRQPLVMEE